MEKQQKKVRNSYRRNSAQSTEELLRALDQASAEGWQLVKVGSFRIHYKKDPNARYRYQMDCRSVDDWERYQAFFREQGWEHVCSSLGGAHFFRKPWDPSLPEGAYEIFTDLESRQQFRSRLSKGALLCCTLYALNAVLRGSSLLKNYNIPDLCMALCWALGAAWWGWTVWITRHPDPARKKRRVWTAVLSILTVLVMLACLGGMLWG